MKGCIYETLSDAHWYYIQNKTKKQSIKKTVEGACVIFSTSAWYIPFNIFSV